MWPCQVYDGVREVRRAVLMNRGEEEIDTDTEWDEFDETSEVITDIDSDDDDDDDMMMMSGGQQPAAGGVPAV